MQKTHGFWTGKSVLVTGGTGSFGSACIKALLATDVRRVICFSRDELKQLDLRTQIADDRARYFLGDIRDRQRLDRALYGVDIVIHAAALKQVPAGEADPSEFIKTNVLGAMNIVEAALERGVQRVLALSTDKACRPANLYGASKLAMERLLIASNVYAGDLVTRFSLVRYGNVIGSRGSVIPRWNTLLAAGATELPLTDLGMTRFWITLDQAVAFVLERIEDMQGGEIFVPQLPTVAMPDLAEAMAPGVPLKITGIRPGEKLHEVLITPEEVDQVRWGAGGGHFVIGGKEGAPWKGGNQYDSSWKRGRLTVAEIRALLGIAAPEPEEIRA